MTRRRLRPWVKQFLIALGFATIILSIIFISEYFDREMEEHIERVSQKCAEKGYGIKANYTKEGDKYYVCNE